MPNLAQIELNRLLELQAIDGDGGIEIPAISREGAMVFRFEDGSTLVICEPSGKCYALPDKAELH